MIFFSSISDGNNTCSMTATWRDNNRNEGSETCLILPLANLKQINAGNYGGQVQINFYHFT
jgi:hypothetical protein